LPNGVERALNQGATNAGVSRGGACILERLSQALAPQKGFLVEHAGRCLSLSLFDDVKLLKPANEAMGCRMSLLFGLRAFDRVQDLVALIDSGTRLLLARKADSVSEIADDPAISQMQFRCENELRAHAAETAS